MREFCDKMVEGYGTVNNVGDLALMTWAAAEVGSSRLEPLVQRLMEVSRDGKSGFTVEEAWTLSALVAAKAVPGAKAAADEARDRLLGSLSPSGIFPHWTESDHRPWWRSHVSCFADQVYPIQALARYHKAYEHGPSLEAAARCADTICRLQGDAGQWWWHYDVRTGGVIEGYPVYSVHQDAMAPMALLDLKVAGGPDHSEAIRKGLEWLLHPPEVQESLIDEENHVIWRKVARGDPKKLVRSLRALSTRLHPKLRLRLLDSLFPPRTIDYECRPYHLGWILYAWLGGL